MRKGIIFILMIGLCFSFSFDIYKLKDLSKNLVGEVNKTKWEESLRVAKLVYQWTKNNIQYDYEEDKKMLNGFTNIRSPYQTFLDRKGNSYEIALLDYVLMYNTGLFDNDRGICSDIPLTKGYDFDPNKYGISAVEDKDKKNCIFEPKNITVYVYNSTLGKKELKTFEVPKYRFLDDFIKKIKECGISSSKLKNLEENILLENPKRNLFFGTIIFRDINKTKAIVAFDVYSKKTLCGYITGRTGNLYPVMMCGNSRTLMILDPEFGIFTLPQYVKFLKEKYKGKARYIALYYPNFYSGTFKLMYFGKVFDEISDLFVVDYSKGENYYKNICEMSNKKAVYIVDYIIEKKYNSLFSKLLEEENPMDPLWLEDSFCLVYANFEGIANQFKKYYPAPYNKVDYKS